MKESIFWDIAQLVKCVARVHEDLGLNHIKFGIVAYVCTPSTQDAEAGGSEIQGWKRSPSYMNLCRDTTLKFGSFSLLFLMKNIKMIKISVDTTCHAKVFILLNLTIVLLK